MRTKIQGQLFYAAVRFSASVFQLSAVRRLYRVGGDAPVNFGRGRRGRTPQEIGHGAVRRGVDFYAHAFQPKQPSHSHTLAVGLLC